MMVVIQRSEKKTYATGIILSIIIAQRWHKYALVHMDK